MEDIELTFADDCGSESVSVDVIWRESFTGVRVVILKRTENIELGLSSARDWICVGWLHSLDWSDNNIADSRVFWHC